MGEDTTGARPRAAALAFADGTDAYLVPDTGRFVIRRGPGAQLTLALPTMFSAPRPPWLLEDLDSKAGTCVNGRKMNRAAVPGLIPAVARTFCWHSVCFRPWDPRTSRGSGDFAQRLRESRSRPQWIRSPMADEPKDRRRFLKTAATVGMTGGLVAGYGTFGAVAGRYLYPAEDRPMTWMFVAELTAMAAGASRTFLGPSGERIAIARQGDGGTADDFVALSSTCPHLGCQVFWQAAENRFFCPCHNGMFDPSGKATAGPPAKAGQALSRYELKVDRGLLFIRVPQGDTSG